MDTRVIQINGSTEIDRAQAKEAVRFAFAAAVEHFGVVELARRLCERDQVEMLKAA
ncbi:hypothetical protein [Herbaspirillum rubrisubalbicans]|uniref:hypothetical protein n=1 Tax=Herbaspirillum rubrisubalbicans TaxID=80842 RepID=UPI0015C58194|nr:hypothetical protein [Herbaspirillum rubrisubalbicans]